MANRGFIEFSKDLLSIPEFVTREGRPHGHRYGKLPGSREYYLVNNLKKGCKKKDYERIHDRFLRDDVFRRRMIENNRDEKVCRAWDVLADEDHTYHMSQEEYFYYRNNWWLHLNKSGNDTQPLRKRSDFKQALSTLKSVYTKKLEENKSSPFLTGSTGGVDRHRVPSLPGGNGKVPGGLPKNSKNVKKDEASKGL